MQIEQVRRLRLAVPFQPFQIELVDGTKLVVKESYNVGIAVDAKHALYTIDSYIKTFGPEEVKSVSLLPNSQQRSA